MKIIINTLVFCSILSLSYAQEIGLNIGNKAPELAYKNPNGEILKLSDLDGKMVLIEFWASWCGPCRKENPNLVRAYRKYNKKQFQKGEGFEIYSLSLDSKKNNWINAIDQDQLFWKYHVSDLGVWQSEGVKKYGIESIPSNILIDKNRIILAKNLKGITLHKFLEDSLK